MSLFRILPLALSTSLSSCLSEWCFLYSIFFFTLSDIHASIVGRTFYIYYQTSYTNSTFLLDIFVHHSRFIPRQTSVLEVSSVTLIVDDMKIRNNEEYMQKTWNYNPKVN